MRTVLDLASDGELSVARTFNFFFNSFLARMCFFLRLHLVATYEVGGSLLGYQTIGLNHTDRQQKLKIQSIII